MIFRTLSAHRVETAGCGSSDENFIFTPAAAALIPRVGVQTAPGSAVAT